MLVLIKGAGDLATGIACRLKHAGMDIIMTELAVPTAVRRTVSFSRAVYENSAVVEGVPAQLAQDGRQALDFIQQGKVAVLVDPECRILKEIRFDAVADAILAKRNTGTSTDQAPIVIGIGPGFTAPDDCHCVIETARGHFLGRVILEGEALPNTGIPGEIGGYTIQRLIRSPCDGIFEPLAQIGDQVQKGQIVASVNGTPVTADLDGVLRGLLQAGVPVCKGMKSGDVDPRCQVSHCYSVSDKARSIAGGVLEGICRFSGCFRPMK